MSGPFQRNPVFVLAVIARMVLGGWFLYTGLIKWQSNGLDRFVQDVANYRLVSAPWDAVVAYGVVSLECVAGLCLFLGLFRRGALMTIAGLVIVFSVAVGWAWIQQLDITCGCRGGDAPIQYWAKFLEFMLYAVVLGLLWTAENAGKLASPMKKYET